MQVVDLRRQLGSQEQEKDALASAKAKLKAAERESKDLKWELEVLRQKFDKVVGELQCYLPLKGLVQVYASL